MSQRQLISIIDGLKVDGGRSQEVVNPYTSRAVALIQLLERLPGTSHHRHTDDNNIMLDKVLSNFAVLLENHAQELVSLAAEETGSPIKYHQDDIRAVIEFTKGVAVYKDRMESEEYKLEAKGRILILLSANEPLVLFVVTVLSALISGNSVFVKPSSKTPSVPHKLTELLLAAGMPASRVSIVLTSQEGTQSLLASGEFNMALSFGSSIVNEQLQKVCHSSTQFIPENEGNDWAYVDELPAQEIEQLSKVLVNSFTKHNGQMCDAVRWILVHKSIYKELVDGMKDGLQKLNIGNPMEKTSDIGSLLWSSSKGDVNQSKPILIELKDLKSEMVSEPAFAPVCWLKSVANADEALSLYNTYNRHGLGFSIFSHSKEAIDLLSHKINAGRININVNPVDINIFSPWGGIRKSGQNGPSSWIERFTNKKLINTGKYGG